MSLNLQDIPAVFFDNPYDTYAALLSDAPACLQPNGTVILSRFDDLSTVYRDTKRFISDKKPLFAPKFGAESALFEHHTTSLVFNDPPLHTRVRKIMVGAMTPRAIERLESSIRHLVEHLLDQMDPAKPVDLISQFAAAIPVDVIGNLVDIPQSDRAPLRDWSLAILGALEPVLTPEQQAEGNKAVTDFVALLERIVADRRANPGDPETDVLTRLIHGQGDAQLSAAEIYQNCIFILNAGHETTTNLIGNGLWLLHQWPEARASLITDPSLLPTVVEEMLRMESPNQFGNRMAVEDVEFYGVKIAAGTDIHLCIGAANRDQRVFQDAMTFAASRHPNKHLAFGGGAHTCVDLSLARMEAQIAISGMLSRFPNYQILDGARRAHRVRFRGFETLPAQLT